MQWVGVSAEKKRNTRYEGVGKYALAGLEPRDGGEAASQTLRASVLPSQGVGAYNSCQRMDE